MEASADEGFFFYTKVITPFTNLHKIDFKSINANFDFRRSNKLKQLATLLMESSLRSRDPRDLLLFIQVARECVTTTSVTINGDVYELKGVPRNVRDISIQIIQLLTEDSTLQEMRIRESFLDEFISALEKLPDANLGIATALRSDWSNKAAVWSLRKISQ